MKLYATALTPDPATAAGDARSAAEAGYDGWLTAETGHDPFIVAALAAQATEGIEIGTAIAVAFARNPMDVAYSANDIQQLSGGRFVLGLGSQIKPHIEKRFSMPWSHPAPRMREFVLALRTIWTAWLDGEELDFRGDFYQHRLMTPFFAGPDHGLGPPQVALAAVGPIMTKVAGEVADVLLTHTFTTEAYVRTVSLPALTEGAKAAGRAEGSVAVAVAPLVVTGRTEQERTETDRAARSQLAFYGSTPAYREVLETEHAWGELQGELNARSKQGRWDDIAGLIDDEVLNAFAIVVDDPDDVGPAIVGRFGDVADQVSPYPTWTPDEQALEALRAHLTT
ncbi:MAG: TIGR03617 family F420-dependent LLM class oxidoreductase [Nitriliruptorales bacterium]